LRTKFSRYQRSGLGIGMIGLSAVVARAAVVTFSTATGLRKTWSSDRSSTVRILR
jgi:hypothetical protein